jgi:predicted dehydrogenase
MSTDFKMMFAGLGAQGGKHRIPAALAVAEETGLVVPAIVDTNVERAIAYQAKYGDPEFLETLRRRGYDVSRDAAVRFRDARVFARVEDALELGADAVTSVVPGAAKPEVGRAAATAGVHLHSDKPTAPTPGEAEQLFDLFDEAGAYLQIGYHLPYMLDQLLAMLRDEQLHMIEWVLSWTRADGIPGAPHFTDPQTGGITGDIAGHVMKMIRPLTGADPIEVLTATASYKAGTDRAETGMDALLGLSNGGHARVIADWKTGVGVGEQLKFVGSGSNGEQVEGRLHANRSDEDKPDPRAFAAVLRREDGGEPLVIGGAPPLYTGAMVAEHVDFVKGCREGRHSDRSTLVVEHTIADIRAKARLAA